MSNIATVFPHKTTTRSTTRSTFADLVKMAEQPLSLAKTEAPAIAPHLCGVKTKDAVIAHNAMTSLWLDIDDGNLSLNDVNQKIADAIGTTTAWLIYSTYSSKPNNRRWRVLIPMDESLPCDDWIEVQRALARLCGGDLCSARVQQILFAPNRGEHYQYLHHEGQLLDSERISALLNEYDNHIHVAVDKVLQTHAADRNEGFGIASVNDACDTEKLLHNYGYKRRGRKWLSPNSSSGTPGVILFDDGRWYSHHSSDSDIGLPCDGGGTCGDAFDLICHFEYGGDTGKALASLAGQLDPEGQQRRQREFMQAQAEPQPTDSHSDFDFSKFSLRGQSADLKKQLLAEVYILDRMALLGEITVFFAPPNSGKTLITLKLLFNAVSNQSISGNDVFYVNADDSLAGLTTKLKLCEQYDIHMLAPGRKGFEVRDFVSYLEKMVSTDTAHGKVIILDTAKKFTRVMDKEASSQFNTKLREFSQAGGSVILLAHTNKNRNGDGKLVAGGTSDLIDDSDCAYVIDVLNDDGHQKTVIFENQKRRGNCAGELVFKYRSDADNYNQLIDSVEIVGDPDAARAEMEAAAQLQKDSKIIAAIEEALRDGAIQKTDLEQEVRQDCAYPRREIVAVIDRYAGDSVLEGKKWRFIKAARKQKNVELLSRTFENITP